MRKSLALFFALTPLAALAQTPLPDYRWLGAGARTRPAYDGSASQVTDLIPSVRYYGKPWFARTTQGILEGGARIEVTPGLHLGAQLAYEPDIKAGASAGVHAEWDQRIGPMPVSLLARARQFVDTDRGAQADLRLAAVVYGGGALTVSLFFQGTWASAKSNQSFYGVTPEVSASTGLPVYAPGSGLLFTTGGVLWGVDLSRSWIVVGNLEARRLQGDAAGSPLVERPTSRYASASLAYRF